MMPLAASVVCAALGATLCWHYPIAAPALLGAFVAWSVTVYLRSGLWLAVVPALLPIIGFATWTGWLIFEEFDILVLGAAAGGYARLGLDRIRFGAVRKQTDRGDPRTGLSVVSLALVVLFAASAAVALYRGIADAGGFQWGWFQGYYDPLNSLRVLKGFALALLMTPLLLADLRCSGDRASALLSTGLAIGATAAAAAVIWERAAFTGILNFSTDYRSTALFWETHVGGAALDGFFALTAPFAVRVLLRASTPRQAAIGAIVVGTLCYACLTTFSRGVYLAVPIAFGALMVLVRAQDKTLRPIGLLRMAGIAALAVIALAVFHLTFRAGGYRTLAAILGAFAVSVPLSEVARNAGLRQWAYGIAGGVVLGAAGIVVSGVLPKGAYIVYGAAFAFCCGLVWRHSQTEAHVRAPAAVAAYLWILVAAAHVARYWGGASALADALVADSVLMAFLVVSALRSKARGGSRVQARGAIIGSAMLLAAIVATFSGGAYMGERFATVDNDLADRIRHWSDGLGYLQGPADWTLGKGLGRFAASYFYGARDSIHPGSYRLGDEDGKPFLALSGPTYPISFGDAFRVSQRVSATPGAYVASFDARASQDLRVHLEVCDKHLLYGENCAISNAEVKPSPSGWEHFTVPLDGARLDGGPWYAPRLAFFSVALETSGRRVDLRNLALVGPDGRRLVANGDFSNGMAHWFFTSDRYHLPWHIKNMALNVLFDQGVVGLVLLTMLIFVASWRLVFGRASAHPLAPYLAAALAGFLVVGLFDSLLDVPRVAFLFYLLLFASLALRAHPQDASTAPPV
ncbi:MAG: hypothetical protein ABI724_10090 [Betaproteobacteria bacterium]